MNTFQVVIITDGVYSFVLYNYPEGGIQWSAPTSVLVIHLLLNLDLNMRFSLFVFDVDVKPLTMLEEIQSKSQQIFIRNRF